jgi:hypothetical protein
MTQSRKRTRKRPTPRAMEDLISAYLRNQELEEAQAYVDRGRKLAKVETRELKDRWVVAFRKMADARQAWNHEPNGNRRNRTDIEAELLIRKVKLPYAAVEKEKAALLAAAKAGIRELQRDPARLLRVEVEFQADLTAFEEKVKKSRPN